MVVTYSDRRIALNRRSFLRTTVLAGMSGWIAGREAAALAAETVTLPFANGARQLVKFPQKRPLLLLTT